MSNSRTETSDSISKSTNETKLLQKQHYEIDGKVITAAIRSGQMGMIQNHFASDAEAINFYQAISKHVKSIKDLDKANVTFHSVYKTWMIRLTPDQYEAIKKLYPVKSPLGGAPLLEDEAKDDTVTSSRSSSSSSSASSSPSASSSSSSSTSSQSDAPKKSGCTIS